MRRVVRSSTRAPRVFSRSATARLTAAFGTPSARAAAEKPLRSTTLASIASWAGVQIRLTTAAKSRGCAGHCFTREARAPVLPRLESATLAKATRKVPHEDLHARDVGRCLHARARQSLGISREGPGARHAAQVRASGAARLEARAGHAAAHPPGADRGRYLQERRRAARG